jgi:hypothetical protein
LKKQILESEGVQEKKNKPAKNCALVVGYIKVMEKILILI